MILHPTLLLLFACASKVNFCTATPPFLVTVHDVQSTFSFTHSLPHTSLDRHLSRTALIPTAFPNCYKGDSQRRDLEIGLIIDTSMYVHLGKSISSTLTFVRELISVASFTFSRQFNIGFILKELIIENATNSLNGPNLNCNKNTYIGNMQQFLNDKGGSLGLWHAITSCFGSAGIAYKGVICNPLYNVGYSSFSPLKQGFVTFLHELGHNFGGDHTFEEGQGNTGGLLDYGNGTLDNIYMFNMKYRRRDMCSHLDTVVSCPNFIALHDKCGNGEIDLSEQCECFNGSKSCQGCHKCILSNPYDDCGKDFFTGKVDDMLNSSLGVPHHPYCCSTSNTFTKLNHCENGNCLNGRCINLCERMGRIYCGSKHSGCTQKCIIKNRICSNTFYRFISGKKTPLNFMPDGSGCNTDGVCNNGKCIQNTQNNPTIYSSPTRQPMSPYPTSYQTPYPTSYQTPYPTSYQTPYPTSSYPTPYPT